MHLKQHTENIFCEFRINRQLSMTGVDANVVCVIIIVIFIVLGVNGTL